MIGVFLPVILMTSSYYKVSLVATYQKIVVFLLPVILMTSSYYKVSLVATYQMIVVFLLPVNLMTSSYYKASLVATYQMIAVFLLPVILMTSSYYKVSLVEALIHSLVITRDTRKQGQRKKLRSDPAAQYLNNKSPGTEHQLFHRSS